MLTKKEVRAKVDGALKPFGFRVSFIYANTRKTFRRIRFFVGIGENSEMDFDEFRSKFIEVEKDVIDILTSSFSGISQYRFRDESITNRTRFDWMYVGLNFEIRNCFVIKMECC